MLTALDENNAPEDFTGRGDALISPFFKSIGKRVGGSPQKRVIVLKDSVKRKYGRYSLNQMFRLAQTQFDGLLTEAGIDTCWRPMIEETASMRFVAPSTADAIVTFSAGRSVVPQEGRGEVKKVKVNTVSDQLGSEQIVRVVVAPAILLLGPQGDADSIILSDPQVTTLSTALILWIYCKTGQFNAGVGLLDHCAKAFAARWKKRYSKKNGWEPIRWYVVLFNRARCLDRPDSTVRRASVTCLRHLRLNPPCACVAELPEAEARHPASRYVRESSRECAQLRLPRGAQRRRGGDLA